MQPIKKMGIAPIYVAIFALSWLSFVNGQYVSVCGPNGGVRITETTIDSRLINIMWMGKNNSVLFAQSATGIIYRSGDEGATWQDQTAKFGTQPRFISPTANESKIYFTEAASPMFKIWTTENEGLTYTERTDLENYKLGFSFFYIFPHPREQNVAIGIGYNKNCFVQNSPKCSFDIYVTLDFAYTWRLVDTYVREITWGAEQSNGALHVIYTTYTDKTGQQSNKASDSAVLIRTDVRDQNSPKTVLYQGVSALFKSPENFTLLFVAERDTDGGMTLLFSETDGESWTPAQFPSAVVENSYTVLDVSDGAVFMNIQEQFGSYYGDVYISDSFASNFAVSLKNNRRGQSTFPFWGGADFSQIEGLDGIFVANVYDVIGGTNDPNADLKTMITFDMGGKWQRIKAPANDSQGNPITCNADECYLNLFGLYESVYGRFYSVPGSIGLMVATGNIGKYLEMPEDDVNTYFSRNAGWTWEEIAKGSLAYEIADHGSLMIFADNSKKVSNLTYSWNEGLTFENCQFTTRGSVDVENIVVEPTWTSQKFIMYGERDNKGVLIHVDFTGLHQAECRNPDKPGQPDSDYELWSPSYVGIGQGCLLGMNTTYVRRKRDARCYNPQQVDRVWSKVSCQCAREDFTCDYCYAPGPDNTCVLSCQDYNINIPPPNCVDYYYASRGYRLIPGDQCQGNNAVSAYLPSKIACPAKPDHPSGNGLPAGAVVAVLLIIVLSTVLIIVASFWLVIKLHKPAFLYDKLKDIKIFQQGSGRSRGSEYAKVSRQGNEEEDSPFLQNE